MIDDTIRKIETKIQGSESIREERKAELLQLLGTLKSEISGVSREHAESIAGFTERSAHEATREKQNPELLDLSIQGMASSVRGFEKSHPQLVQIVNSISQTLSNLGI